MMRLLLYEFVTGGGAWDANLVPNESPLFAEGESMWQTIAWDLLQIPGLQVDSPRDCRLPFGGFARGISRQSLQLHPISNRDEEERCLRRLAKQVDAALIIAPETGGALAERTSWLEQVGVPLVTPGSQFVQMAAQKQATCDWLARYGIPVPDGRRLQPCESLPLDFPYPAVWKPDIGAGSVDTIYLGSTEIAARIPAVSMATRLEVYCPGVPCSVGLLASPSSDGKSTGMQILPPMEQILSTDGYFQYQGGRRLRKEPLVERALALAQRVAHVLSNVSGVRGYLGIDMVLHSVDAKHDPIEDRVIEMNPRLTTSYLGYRTLAVGNLAEWILRCGLGLDGHDQPIGFSVADVEFSPTTI